MIDIEQGNNKQEKNEKNKEEKEEEKENDKNLFPTDDIELNPN